MAILGAAAGRGWRLAEVQSAVACGAWKGLSVLYERRSEPGRLERLLPYEAQASYSYGQGQSSAGVSIGFGT